MCNEEKMTHISAVLTQPWLRFSRVHFGFPLQQIWPGGMAALLCATEARPLYPPPFQPAHCH